MLTRFFKEALHVHCHNIHLVVQATFANIYVLTSLAMMHSFLTDISHRCHLKLTLTIADCVQTDSINIDVIIDCGRKTENEQYNSRRRKSHPHSCEVNYDEEHKHGIAYSTGYI